MRRASGSGGAALWVGLSAARQALSNGNDHEVVVGDRILVLLAQEPLIDEHVKVRRVRVREFPLEHANRVDVLQTSEDQLFFFFALPGVFPDRHGDRHHHRHDAHGDEQGRHCIPSLTAAPPDCLTR